MDKMKNKILHLLFILISQKYQNKNVDIPVIIKSDKFWPCPNASKSPGQTLRMVLRNHGETTFNDART